MKQRIPHTWSSPHRTGDRPRVVIEDSHPAAAISDFSMFTSAGFEVAYCSGPGPIPAECPLLRGGRCALLDGADAVLQRLDPRLGVAPAIRQRHPRVAVVTEQPPRTEGGAQPSPAAGYEPVVFACSVRGQIQALHRALESRPGR